VLSPTHSRQGALLAFAQLSPWPTASTSIDWSATPPPLLVRPEASMLHRVSLQPPPWYAPRALPMGVDVRPSAALATLALAADGTLTAVHAVRPRAPVQPASTTAAPQPPAQVVLLTDPRCVKQPPGKTVKPHPSLSVFSGV